MQDSLSKHILCAVTFSCGIEMTQLKEEIFIIAIFDVKSEILTQVCLLAFDYDSIIHKFY